MVDARFLAKQVADEADVFNPLNMPQMAVQTLEHSASVIPCKRA